MKRLKENKPLQFALGMLVLVFLCCYLPQEILFLKLCMEQDHDIPSNAEVLISACKYPAVRGVPGGEVMFVRELETGKTYLLDLRTGEKRKLPNDPLLVDKGIFLSSELVWLVGSSSQSTDPGYRPHYILDLENGKRYELLDLKWLPRLEEGRFDPKYFEYIQSADRVFIHHSNTTLIAMSRNYREGSEGNVIFYEESLGVQNPDHNNGELLIQLADDLDVDYELVDYSLYYTEIPSPKNKYIARFDGIYLADTNPPILIRRGAFNYFKSWYYDDSAIVVQGSGDYLIIFPGISTVYFIPSPVLKLNLLEP